MICPKCGVKIKPFDWRQNCRKCGVNLFLHDFDKRLAQDSVQAQLDYKWWTNMTENFLDTGYRDRVSLLRVLICVIPAVVLALPVVEFNGKKQMMIIFLMDILGGGKIFPEGFSVSDMGAYKAFLPAMLLLIGSFVLAFFAFVAVVAGPAFLHFKTPFIIYCLIVPVAAAGTWLFRFDVTPSLASQLNAAVTPSYGLYIYLAALIINLVYLGWFAFGYTKKFDSRREKDNA